jgi:ABC-type Fe3+/spermidine/putrescine transport system ATPase subunit
MEKALKDANKESASRRKEIERYEQAETERVKAAMSETDRLKAEVEEAKKQAAEAKAEQTRIAAEAASQNLKTQILLRASAMDFANPQDAYALLDLAEVNADESETIDKALAKLEGRLPKKTQARQAPRVSPTQPGGAASGEMTDDQLRAEIFGVNMRTPFTTDVLKAKGGGVFWNTKATPQ